MKETINRARAAMNIILVLSILTWWINNISIDILKEIEPDFNSLVKLVDEFYDGSNMSTLREINSEESKFVFNVFGSLQFYKSSYEDPALGLKAKLNAFAKRHRMIDIMGTSKVLNANVVIITSQTIHDGSMEFGTKYNQLTRILLNLGYIYNNISEKLMDFSSHPAVDANETILEAHRALRMKIKVPILNVSVTQLEVNKLFALSIGIILCYLLSTTLAMHRLCKIAPLEEMLQWIFFHPTPIGTALGIIWLLFPAATLAVNHQWIEAIIVGMLGSSVIGSAIRCRLAFNKRG
jgi:hypothetical protein